MEKPRQNPIQNVEERGKNDGSITYMLTVEGMGYFVEAHRDGTILLKTSETGPVFNLGNEEVPGHPQLTHDVIAEAMSQHEQREKAQTAPAEQYIGGAAVAAAAA